MTVQPELASAIPDLRGINLYRYDRDAAPLFAHYLPAALFRDRTIRVVPHVVTGSRHREPSSWTMERPSRLVADDPATDPLYLGVPAVRAVVVVRAVLAVAFGIVALTWPDLTLLALAVAFGVYAILEGVASMIDAVRNRGRSRWWWGLLSGLASLVAGVIALIWPSITAVALALLVGIWAVVTGVAEIVVAFRLRGAGRGIWWLGLAGALSVAAGILIVLWPAEGAIGLAVVLGVFALLYGAVLGVLAVSLRLSAPPRRSADAADLRRADGPSTVILASARRQASCLLPVQPFEYAFRLAGRELPPSAHLLEQLVALYQRLPRGLEELARGRLRHQRLRVHDRGARRERPRSRSEAPARAARIAVGKRHGHRDLQSRSSRSAEISAHHGRPGPR